MILEKMAAHYWRSGLFLALVTVALPFGCSKSGPGGEISSATFDAAPAEVKQSWNDALSAWKSHRYMQAATNFVALQSKASSLSPQQSEALTKAVDQFGQEAFQVANKGDADATEAVKSLRGTGRRATTPQ